MYPDQFQRNGKILTNKLHIANGFNEFFVNVGPGLANKIKSPSSKSHIFDYMKSRNDKSMFINDVTQNELCKGLNNFHCKASADVNDISMCMVKKVFYCIIHPFQHICNLSLRIGIFPDNMKIAKIIPLFKTGDDSEFTNYRPVSLLPQFSKILEKMFNNRLDNFIKTLKILVY